MRMCGLMWCRIEPASGSCMERLLALPAMTASTPALAPAPQLDNFCLNKDKGAQPEVYIMDLGEQVLFSAGAVLHAAGLTWVIAACASCTPLQPPCLNMLIEAWHRDGCCTMRA